MTMHADPELEDLLAQHRADGSLVRQKARMLVEQEVLTSYFEILSDPTAPASVKLEAGKQLIALSDLSPKQAQGPVGPGMSIQFILPGQAEPLTISGRATLVEPTEDPLSPASLATARALNADLAGDPGDLEACS